MLANADAAYSKATQACARADAAPPTVTRAQLRAPPANLVLCHADDAPAAWLAHALRSRGVALEVVTVEALAYSRRIVFRQDSAGDGGSVTLHDGRVLRPQALAVLIDRVRYLPVAHFAAAAPEERAYAESELGALLLGWRHAVPGRVINPVRPGAPGGDAFSSMGILHAAAMAGLPTMRWQASSETAGERRAPAAPHHRPHPSHGVIAFDGRVYGPPLPRPLRDGVRRLAALLGLPLLQVGLDRDSGGEWRFIDATGNVDFRRGGLALARDLAGIMAACPAA